MSEDAFLKTPRIEQSFNRIDNYIKEIIFGHSTINKNYTVNKINYLRVYKIL